jgi:hypothetical protein
LTLAAASPNACTASSLFVPGILTPGGDGDFRCLIYYMWSASDFQAPTGMKISPPLRREWQTCSLEHPLQRR